MERKLAGFCPPGTELRSSRKWPKNSMQQIAPFLVNSGAVTQGKNTWLLDLLLPDAVVPACQASRCFNLSCLCQHFQRPEPATWPTLAGRGSLGTAAAAQPEGPAPTGAACDGAQGERGEALAALQLQYFPLSAPLISTVVLASDGLHRFGL